MCFPGIFHDVYTIRASFYSICFKCLLDVGAQWGPKGGTHTKNEAKQISPVNKINFPFGDTFRTWNNLFSYVFVLIVFREAFFRYVVHCGMHFGGHLGSFLGYPGLSETSVSCR